MIQVWCRPTVYERIEQNETLREFMAV